MSQPTSSDQQKFVTQSGSISVEVRGRQPAQEAGTASVGQVCVCSFTIDGVLAEDCFWQFPPGVIKNYEFTDTQAVLTPLQPSDLTANPTEVIFYEPGEQGIFVSGFGPEGPASTGDTAQILAPDVESFGGQIGQATVAVDTNQQPWFQLLLEGPPGPSADGVYLQATVANPELAGTIGLIQLACNERFITHTDNSVWQLTINGNYVLDTGGGQYLFYQNQQAEIESGEVRSLDMTDAPGMPLDSSAMSGLFVPLNEGDTPESYQTYLMFQPDDPGAIWVALAMVAWNWNGFTSFVNGDWEPAQGEPIPPIGGPTMYPPPPTWNTNNNPPAVWVPVASSSAAAR
jgi:hypothetical protein